MINNLFSRQPQHLNPDPAQRAQGIASLEPDSAEIARLMRDDPSPQVRIAAARRCKDAGKLAEACQAENDDSVRAVLTASLGEALDALSDVQQRNRVIEGLQAESLLIDLALGAGHAETRKAAAAHVNTTAGLARLADAAKSKDRGVAKLAQQRLDALANSAAQTTEADAIISELTALASRAGPVLSATVELDRRWHALNMANDAQRTANYAAARETLQARFSREQDGQRARTQFERTLGDWLAKLAAPAAEDELVRLRSELAEFRNEAQLREITAALERIAEAEQRLTGFEVDLASHAQVEVLVREAERLAADTTVDDAQLPLRWQAIDRKLRTPALTQRFETALIIVEQRRLALVESTRQQSQSARQEVHAQLNSGEQALAAGHLQAARAAADNIKKFKLAAGTLPKPTTQRIGRLVQQLVELERWESFGQQNARVQLCERAEALASQTLDPPRVASEVQKLRNEWKALDQQHAGVPKALWERFNGACERAYAPAARFFAEQSAQRKQGRKQRDEFIAAAAVHAPTLLEGTRDWRTIERWLRETEQKWREGDLGSVEPRAWKKLDGEFKTALAPLREALAAARTEAKARRTALIEEAKALAGKAMERDTLTQVKALQARWQEEAKKLSLLQRDERPLWEQFRAACDAVFTARDAKRKEREDSKQQGRRALEEICAQLEALATAGDKTVPEIRKAARELADQWRQQRPGGDPALRGVEARYKKAQTALDALAAGHARAQKAAVWTTLAAKTELCDELDAHIAANDSTDQLAVTVDGKWTALPVLPDDWEKKLASRRDTALKALADPALASGYRTEIEKTTGVRRERLLELEIALGLDSPPDMQQQRLAMQVKQLRDRFKSARETGADNPADRLLAWCIEPGIVDAADRKRSERIFARVSAKS